MRPIPSRSWNNPRLEVRVSSVHGQGIFATAPIARDEVVTIWGGALFTRAEIAEGKALPRSFVAVTEELFLGHPPEHGTTVDDFINHSCDPSLWMLDEITLAARRDIARDEELSIDYAMYLDDDWTAVACRCGTSQCRGSITREDWRIPALIERYRGRFAPYIRERIARIARLGR